MFEKYIIWFQPEEDEDRRQEVDTGCLLLPPDCQRLSNLEDFTQDCQRLWKVSKDSDTRVRLW